MRRLVYALPLRQTEGFLTSILALMEVDLPDHLPLCRRQADWNIDLPVQSRPAPIHWVVDSTGLKVDGEGEWKRTSGYHRRAVVETQRCRYKQLIRRQLRARCKDNQETEARMGWA